MQAIRTQAEFEAVTDSKRAIVFVSFAWSLQASLSQQVVTEWERTWNIWHPKLDVKLFKLEPDEHPYTWAWLKETSERGGYGYLAWIKNGALVDSEPNVVAAGSRDIARRTERAFGED